MLISTAMQPCIWRRTISSDSTGRSLYRRSYDGAVYHRRMHVLDFMGTFPSAPKNSPFVPSSYPSTTIHFLSWCHLSSPVGAYGFLSGTIYFDDLLLQYQEVFELGSDRGSLHIVPDEGSPGDLVISRLPSHCIIPSPSVSSLRHLHHTAFSEGHH